MKINIHSLILILVITVISLLCLSGLRGVPYHPDESTQIFMSSDLRAFFRAPASLFWQPGSQFDLRQHYRVMDAPLTRYLIGIARWTAGLPDQKVDWDWSRNWQSNKAVGALPDDWSLWVSRLAAACLSPFSLLLVYLNGRELGGRTTGWLAMLLFAGNGLVLLHTRRAMAESALVMTSLLAVWAMLRWKRHTWLVALPLALAFNAKQTAGVLLLPGLVALIWHNNRGWKEILRNCALFGLLFLAVTLALNPFLWQHPLAASTDAWLARAAFTKSMTASILSTGAKLPVTLPERLAAELFNVFFAAPSIAETGNYTQATLAAETEYFANPLHNLMRGQAGGGLMLALTLLGLILACRKLIRTNGQQRRVTALLLIVTLTQILVLAWIITIPWQRYYIVLAPLASIWAGLALAGFVQGIAAAMHKENPIRDMNR